MEFKIELLCQPGDELLVLVGVRSANAVMEMRHREHHSKLFPQFQQPAQERHRICSAGNGYGDPLSGLKQSLFENRLAQLVQHS